MPSFFILIASFTLIQQLVKANIAYISIAEDTTLSIE